MIKAVFVDYMGTTVDERSPEMAEIVRRICKHSSVPDPKQVQRFIRDMETLIGLTDEPDTLRGLIRSHWVNAPVFPYARAFFERCPVPIYIITNNGTPYMEQALERNGLRPAGVISADTVRAYKPHREIFDEALRLSGCTTDDAVHIGDSYDTDVMGARGAGIHPVLLHRGGAQVHEDVDTVDDLTQALKLLFNQ